MFALEPPTISTVFVGHTSLPAAPPVPSRRFVNVGSAGEPLDGDTRACYVVAERGSTGTPGDWHIEVCRTTWRQ
jgi:diadenosine tetraphosphatase ApaH/serine/threonine PP2A family protein phosphatase